MTFPLDDWSPEAQRDFWARHARKRVGKDAMVVGKAQALFRTGDPDKRAAARTLILELAERQEAAPKAFALHRTALAKWLAAAGELEEAEAQLRRSLAYLEQPGRNDAERISTAFELATVLARRPDAAAWREADALFELNQQTPMTHPCAPYDALVAACTATLRLTPTGSGAQVAEAPQAEVLLDELEVGAPTTEALAALGALLRSRPLYARFPRAFLESELFPDLGAHLGNVVVREHGASWEPGATLTTSRVKLGEERLDPFRYAFHVIFRRYPLTDFLARLRFLGSA